MRAEQLPLYVALHRYRGSRFHSDLPGGEVGKDSLAAVLAQEGSGDLKIDYNEPYAEVRVAQI